MRNISFFFRKNYGVLFFMISLMISTVTSTAQMKVTDFILFGGTGVQIGSSNTINGGSVGSYTLVQSTGNAAINSNINSGGKIILTNSNVAGVTDGKISAANSTSLAGTILSVGSSATIKGNVDVNGNVVIGGGIVSGTITLPPGKTYTGPVPAGGTVFGSPALPILPSAPLLPVKDLTGYPTITTSITNNLSTGPGNFGNINFSGNKTLTLTSPGSYVFNSIKMTGNSNSLVFKATSAPGNYYIYIKGNVDFGKLSCIGGDASRIYAEVQGNGSGTSIPGYSFIIANGSSGGGSKWTGTVWAKNGGINIGSGTGSSTLTGALYSSTQVNIQSGVELFYAPFTFCNQPNANAGLDKPLDFFTQTLLVGSSTTPGVTFNWQPLNGGIITTSPNNDSIKVSVAGAYVLTVASGKNCVTTDTVVVTSRLKSIIGSELQSIYDNKTKSSPFFVIQNDSVMVDIIANSGFRDSVLHLLQNDTANYGLRYIISNGSNRFIITGKFPIKHLPNLNLLTKIINYCRPYYPAVNYTDFVIDGNGNVAQETPLTGLINSAGDTTMRSYLVRKGYKINGSGVKIGVISDSYGTIPNGTNAVKPFQPVVACSPSSIAQSFATNTAAIDVANGELPSNVHVLNDFPFQSSDEGRAMMQIVHDVAPGAELYFRTGIFTPGDFAIGIKELREAGCKVIVDDITYITEPFLKDGIVAKTVDSVKSQGVTYFSAAGNFANKSYEKDFKPVTIATGALAGKKAHDFGGGDIYQHVKLAPGNYTIVLQWEDSIYSSGQGGTKNDMDIYLTENTDGTALFGFNRDNTNGEGGDPIEFIPFTIPPPSFGNCTDTLIDANILILNNTATSNPEHIKYIVFRGDIKILEFNEGTSTLVGQGNAAGAIAVGAARFDKAPPYLKTPLMESFSSIGGTKTNKVVRRKPDLTGPDGVNTTVKLGQDYPNNALDGYSNFFGTSAAAPHAAAVAALLIEGRKKFLGQNITLPDTIKALLDSTAVDIGVKGFDFTSGYGLVNADLAMRTFAAPTPSLNKLLIIPVTSPPAIPGDDVDSILVTGENFSSNSIIYFKDSALASTHIISTDSAVAIIPKFEDNPGIRMYTPPYPTTIMVNGQHPDGGFSNSLFFFTADITIKADSLTKKYGQLNPSLSAVIRINGKLLQDTTVTLESIGLNNMTLTTPASTFSDVGTYIISFANNIPPAALLQKYNYRFTTGTLTIEKMPLKVAPLDKVATEGQYIGNVAFKYEFDHTNVPNPDSILSLIKTYHQGYVPNNALAVIKDFSKTQSNGSVLTSADLANLNMIATFKAVKNSRKFQVNNNNELVPLTDSGTINMQYLLDVASESIYNYKGSPNQGQFFNAYSGITSKAILGAAALNNDDAKVQVNGTLVKLVNGSLEQMVNTATGPVVPILEGNFVQIINGELYPVPDGSLVQLANGTLVKLVNGTLVKLVNGTLVKLVNGTLVKLVNGTAVQIINGVETPILTNVIDISSIPNGTLVKLVNGTLVKMVNGTLVKLVNGSAEQVLNGSLVKLVNGTLVKLVNGSTLGLDAGGTTNNTAVIVDQTDVDPLQENWLGAMFGINMITGLNAGTQWLIPGVLVNSNFDISYGLGKVTINNDPCTITHSLDKSFGSTANPGTATSLWLNMVTKVSGQLKTKGDYLSFKSGAITFNNISSTPTVTNLPLPNGKIIADNVSAPFTKYEAATNTWITKVPIGFASTSDIFVTGVIINSSTGFVKNNNASTSLKGIFNSNTTFKDQWAYASAAYQPQFTYASIADSCKVASINGNYKAGTPIPQISKLVNGGSGGGGNNYTGSTNSYDRFTACISSGTTLSRVYVGSQENISNNFLQEGFRVNPNPAKNYIDLSFVSAASGTFKIELFTVDGKKVSGTYNGINEAGVQYNKKIDVSKLISGVYLVELKSRDKIIIKKIIISR